MTNQREDSGFHIVFHKIVCIVLIAFCLVVLFAVFGHRMVTTAGQT